MSVNVGEGSTVERLPHVVAGCPPQDFRRIVAFDQALLANMSVNFPGFVADVRALLQIITPPPNVMTHSAWGSHS